MSKEPKNLEQRDGFQSKWGFILACIGSAVGMGNIWRFPIMVQKYGGMTFLLPYFIFVILIGSTGVIEEFALGRRAAAGPVGAFGMCTKERTGSEKSGKAIGAIPIIGALMLAIGYTVVLGWIFKYTFMSLSGSLFSLGTDMGAIGGTFGATAPEAATLPEALKAMASAGFFGIGNGVWQIVALVVSLAIMVMGVAGGIEKANKVMMPVLFGLFLVLAIYIGTLPGASAGYKYILTLNPAGLAKPDLWVFAFGQAFFSLSVAGNGSVIYGSYLSKSEDIPSSARNVAVFDTIAALLAAFVIIPAMAVVLGEGINDVSGGPGLMFVYLVNVFNAMPAGRIIGAIFLHLRTVRRRILHRKPVRGTDRFPAGAVQVQACSSRWHHRCDRSGRFHRNPAVDLSVDGRCFHLHLPARRCSGRHHVLLGTRQGKGTCCC